MTSAALPPPGRAASPPLVLGGAITGVVVFAVVSWIALGAYILHFQSYFVAFLLLWYWASVQKADFRKLPSAIVGALCGLGLTWALRSLTGALGTAGLAAAAILIAVAILCEVMTWAPLAFNPCTMLFLTVASIPPLMAAENFLEIAGSLLAGTAYLSLIAWVAQTLGRKLTQT